MGEERDILSEDPIEGMYVGDKNLERLNLLFLSEHLAPVALVEGSKFPAPEVGDKVTFGEGEYIWRERDGEYRDTRGESGSVYEIIERKFNFSNQKMDFQDLKIGPITRGKSGEGLTTTITYKVQTVPE